MEIMVYLINISNKSIEDILNDYKDYLSNKDIKNAFDYKLENNRKQELMASILRNKYINSDIYYNDRGKPMAKDVLFNISHSDDYVVMAKSNDIEIGVDIEHIKKDIKDNLINYIFSEEEKEFIRKDKSNNFTYLWTRKEAILKCVGVGLIKDLKSVEVLNNDGKYRLYSYFIDDYALTIATNNDGKERKINIIKE